MAASWLRLATLRLNGAFGFLISLRGLLGKSRLRVNAHHDRVSGVSTIDVSGGLDDGNESSRSRLVALCDATDRFTNRRYRGESVAKLF